MGLNNNRMFSLFQQTDGSLHLPSLLMFLSWLAGSGLTAVFMFANLKVNRNDRLNAADAAKFAAARIEELEDRTRPKPFKERLWSFFNSVDPKISEDYDQGIRIFKGQLTAYQYATLQKFVGEPEAKGLINFEIMGAVYGVGPDGSMHGLIIHLGDNLSSK